ncbi:MAG: SRPBCC family protein [Ottowia sp.]|uniref:SRPBCC family protein n=1 Tax=Ottowia sp. TaxID=1898956 RepID=UPI0039E3C303
MVFDMPAPEAVVFDAFHYHRWRPHWDSLVRRTVVAGGAECPEVGAVSDNGGAGWLRLLSMRTRFVTYDRPRLAAATMLGQSFPFRRWAASMRHEPTGPGGSRLIYTYTLQARWPWLEPLVARVFEHSTRRRFARLQAFLSAHADEVRQWQDEHGLPHTPTSPVLQRMDT